jgi:methionine-S-sulfoxide reductase
MAEHTATLAGGCFWCTEAVFNDVVGVSRVESGYIGGHVSNPTYRQVCDGNTGHAEAVRITFDPDVIGFDDVLISISPRMIRRSSTGRATTSAHSIALQSSRIRLSRSRRRARRLRVRKRIGTSRS